MGNICTAFPEAFTSEYDNVTTPEHYTFGNVQLKDAWKACMSKEAFCGLLKGNVLKYVWRYEHKNGVEDLKKARQYLNWLIEELEEDLSDD